MFMFLPIKKAPVGAFLRTNVTYVETYAVIYAVIYAVMALYSRTLFLDANERS
ncbi:MAG: hypothetical protein ACI8VI_001301 [Granulosicoccus sp.]|jgi:hypothetical protein